MTEPFSHWYQRSKGRIIFHFSAAISLISAAFMIYALKVSAFNYPHGYTPRWVTIKITIDWQLFLLPGKVIEVCFVLIGWLLVLVGKQTGSSLCYFTALQQSTINFLLFLPSGVCVWSRCTGKKSGCVVPSYFHPPVWVPAYVVFQLMTWVVLFRCNDLRSVEPTDKTTDSVQLPAEIVQKFCGCFESIIHSFQLLGVLILFSVMSFFGCIILMFYFGSVLPHEYASPFHLGFMVLGLITKFVIGILVSLGFKRLKSTFLLASFVVSALTLLLLSIAHTAFVFSYITSINNLLKHRDDICRIIYLAILMYSLELFALRSMWLLFRRFQIIEEKLPAHIDRLPRISQSQLKIGKVLGMGSFGEVCLAEMIHGTKQPPKSNGNQFLSIVAIKRLKSSASEEMKYQFLEEAILMSRFTHKNIVAVVGLCMDTRPMSLCMEYMNGGSLEGFLRSQVARSTLTESHLLSISLDVAEACCYLEQEGFIHRDIAGRNCLTKTGLNNVPIITKLSDFNLTKDVESCKIYKICEGMIPVGWTAPEGLIWGVFTPKTDIWSFGVLLWEIFSWCAVPYSQCIDETEQHICPVKVYSNDEIMKLLKHGRINLMNLQEPCSSSFTDSIRVIMKTCCDFDPDQRPNFVNLCQMLKKYKDKLADGGMTISHVDSPACFPAEKFFSNVSSSTNRKPSAETVHMSSAYEYASNPTDICVLKHQFIILEPLLMKRE